MSGLTFGRGRSLMRGVAPQMCRSSSPSIVRRRSRGSLPRLPLTQNDFPIAVQFGFCVQKRLQ